MKKPVMPMPKGLMMKNMKASEIGKAVADHGEKKMGMQDKMANLRAAKGKK
jgi:hypothetical protein